MKPTKEMIEAARNASGNGNSDADLERIITAALAAIPAVSAIVPPHCSGYSFVFDPGVIHVNKDGSGYIAINEDDFVLEDDRDVEGGSVHWITRLDASEVTALRDFLSGVPATSLASENERLRAALEFVRAWAWRDDPPSASRNLSDRERLLAIKYHPVINCHPESELNKAALDSGRREPHPDNLAVDRFAAAMKAKLAKKRDEGRGGWENKEDCSNAFLSHLLFEHVQKGDPVDVGNLAMMIHQRGEAVGAPEEYVAAIVQLNSIVDAWEALPGGRQVKNSDVERWLAKHMGPAIDAIRGFLRRPRPDGFLPPSPQSATAKAALERT